MMNNSEQYQKLIKEKNATTFSGGNTLIGYSAGTDVSGANRGLTTGQRTTVVGHQALGASGGTEVWGIKIG